MKCPVPCSECGEVVELHTIHFRVRCDCHPEETCTHGICDACLDEYLDEEDAEAA